MGNRDKKKKEKKRLFGRKRPRDTTNGQQLVKGTSCLCASACAVSLVDIGFLCARLLTFSDFVQHTVVKVEVDGILSFPMTVTSVLQKQVYILDDVHKEM